MSVPKMPRFDIILVESELNRMMRPGLAPLLPYCRSPRHTAMLIAEYQLETKWFTGSVQVTMKAGDFSAVATSTFETEKERGIALGYAVGKVVWSGLCMVEQREKNRDR